MHVSLSKTSLNSSIFQPTMLSNNNIASSSGDTVGSSYSTLINSSNRPTVSSSNNTSNLRKNISIQENNGILKSGMVTVSFQTSVSGKKYIFFLKERYNLKL